MRLSESAARAAAVVATDPYATSATVAAVGEARPVGHGEGASVVTVLLVQTDWQGYDAINDHNVAIKFSSKIIDCYLRCIVCRFVALPVAFWPVRFGVVNGP